MENAGRGEAGRDELGGREMARGRASRRVVVWASLAVLLAYIAWILGPYLHTVIVRDAAVTSWVNRVASPIKGYVGTGILHAGEKVGEDGRLATVENPDADATSFAQARAALDGARGRQAALSKLVDNLHQVVDARRAQLAAFATAFDQKLDANIRAADNKLALVRKRLARERTQIAQQGKPAANGNASRSAADDQQSLDDLQSAIGWAKLRRTAADRDVFILDNGTDASEAARSLDDSRMALRRAQADLAAVTSEVAADKAVAAAALSAYQGARSSPVLAPPGAMVWSLIAAPGEAVQAGAPIATWIDCHVLLVDVPVSDVELALLHRGGEADVLLEGESKVRKGSILLTRGAAATLGRDDLAAVAKGRTRGIGQVLVSLKAGPAEVEACPIGLAAHVDFPKIGFFDVLLARLRL